MSIRATCPGCGRIVKGGDDWAGRSAKCPGCGATIAFPESDPFEGLEDFVSAKDTTVRTPAAAVPPPLPIVPTKVSPPPIAPAATHYEYYMEQIPPTITVQESKGNEAARYLQSVVNRQAQQGWEFYRVDEIGVHVEPGCLGFLMGVRTETTVYHVITFRRPAAGA